MAITALKVEGYRSIRQVELKLGPISVLVRPNGVGKTNLYRWMFLLAAAAGGQLARTVVEEGGMPSVLWAGLRKKGAVRMVLDVTLEQLAALDHRPLGAPRRTLRAPLQRRVGPPGESGGSGRGLEPSAARAITHYALRASAGE
jgi:predicted ATPase